MAKVIRVFMLVEAASFIAAALVHSGVLLQGYQDPAARTAEGVIAFVLLAGTLLAWARPAWTRPAGLVAQGFALFGTLVGLFTIAIGIGPRLVLDVVYHISIALVLTWGLMVTGRARSDGAANAIGRR